MLKNNSGTIKLKVGEKEFRSFPKSEIERNITTEVQNLLTQYHSPAR